MFITERLALSLQANVNPRAVNMDGRPQNSDRSNGDFRVLGSTNTQTRRLGYLSVISQMLRKSYLPKEVLSRRLLRWSINQEENLSEYGITKGIIRTHTAAERYIDLSANLGLTGEINNYYRPTQVGRLLNIDNETENSFYLAKDALYLVYQIFYKDANYIIATIDLIKKYEKQQDILENTKDEIIRNLRGHLNNTDDRTDKDRIREKVDSIRSWGSPKSYSEHLIMPRIHWLIDLGLVKISKEKQNKYRLTKIGKLIDKSLPSYEEGRYATRRWCQNDLFRTWRRKEESRAKWNELTSRGRQILSSTYLNKGFTLLRTSAHDRISALQYIIYFTSSICFDLNISCGFKDVKKSIRGIEDEENGIVFYWNEKSDSGYILKE